MELSLQTRAVADHTVLEVGGEIDVYTAPRLRERLHELVDAGAHRILVDMQRVEFLDSTGLGVLVGVLKRLRTHNGGLALICTHERILKIFRITGLERVFDIYPSVSAATQAANPGPPARPTSPGQTSPSGPGTPGSPSTPGNSPDGAGPDSQGDRDAQASRGTPAGPGATTTRTDAGGTHRSAPAPRDATPAAPESRPGDAAPAADGPPPEHPTVDDGGAPTPPGS